MEVLIPALTALVLGKPIIGALARLNIRQTIYAYAPETHRSKEGTPTMGGFLMLVAVAVGWCLLPFVPALPFSMMPHMPLSTLFAPLGVLFGASLLFALLGFVDDYLIRRWLGKRGLEWKSKLMLQILAALIALYATTLLPFQLVRASAAEMGGQSEQPLLFWLLGLLWVVGWVNAFNLTDGLDGLAAGLSAIAFGALAVMARDALSVASAMLWCGACVGYLWWNVHPARVFMGDTGSMALGATFGLITWRELTYAAHASQFSFAQPSALTLACLFVLTGLVFAVEIVSVVLQLSAVKLLRRRLFRATPIHHHFELLGWHESQIVGRFWIVGALAALGAYALWGGMR
jgi:phospho-N-acetylmuramoyl-pentapeptide-transferase